MKSSSTLLYAAVVAIVLSVGCSSGGGGVTGSQGTAHSSAKAITAFSFTSPAATGIVSEPTHAIAVTVPAGTNVTALIATFTTTGTSVTIGGTAQVGGVTPNNFTNPVVYTVTAVDGTTVNYTVTVTVSTTPVPSSKAFLTFELAGVSGTINESSKTISLVLPPDGTDVTTLIAIFTVSSGATVNVGVASQTSGVTQNDFTHPVVYTVVASDSTTASYTVSVSLLAAPKLMTAFSFSVPTNAQAPGVISQAAKTIGVTVPLAADITSLVASYTVSTGAIVKVGSTVQISGVTQNNFTNPVVYTVTAPDGLSVDYTVTVAVSPPRMMSFVFSSVSVTGVISQTVYAVAAIVPASTDITTLVSTFTTSNASTVAVGAAPQTSGVTPNDFTSPVVYVLTGASSTNYTVTVTKAPGVLSLPRTGQITSYSTSTSSDDGTIQRGVVWPNPRFAVAGAIVTDNLTGLQWPQNANTPTVGGCTGDVMNWQDALAYVDCLNTNNYLTHNDWRMPNANELMSLLSAKEPTVFSWLNTQGFNNMQGNFYFSSTTDPVITTQARIVNMVTGNSVFGNKTDLLNVLPVRGTSNGRAPVAQTGQTTSYDSVNNADDGALQIGFAWPSPRFTNPDSTTPISGNLVVDQLTGLMWTADGNTPDSATCPMKGTWQGALDYIYCLNTNAYLGYNDWRLPNVNELESLINAGQTDSSSWMNSLGFSNVQGNAYWSSTTDATTTTNAWLVFMVGGEKESTAKTNTGNGGIKAWPVRSGF